MSEFINEFIKYLDNSIAYHTENNDTDRDFVRGYIQALTDIRNKFDTDDWDK